MTGAVASTVGPFSSNAKCKSGYMRENLFPKRDAESRDTFNSKNALVQTIRREVPKWNPSTTKRQTSLKDGDIV